MIKVPEMAGGVVFMGKGEGKGEGACLTSLPR